LIFALTVFPGALAAADDAADSVSPESGNPFQGLSIGAGYERYQAEWRGNHSAEGAVFQHRAYVRGDYYLARRLRAGIKLGAADLTAPYFDEVDPGTNTDYGFSPYGSVTVNWTPLGALPGSRGGAIEVLLEVSGFATFDADKFDGTYLDWGGEVREYEAWPEVTEMWEGRLGVLFGVHNKWYSFGAGLMFLESGAESRTRVKTRWYDGVLTNYFRTAPPQVGMLYRLSLLPGLAMLVDTEVVWTPPYVQFEISASRILVR
jgi:hypothetical protein